MLSRRTFLNVLAGAVIATPLTLLLAAEPRTASALATQQGGRARFYSVAIKDLELAGSADRFASCTRTSIAVVNDAKGAPDRLVVLCHF